MIWLRTPPISEGRCYDSALCAAALGLEPQDLLPVEPQLLNAGNRRVIVAAKDNLSAVLKAAGKSFDDVARVGVFLTSMSDYGAMKASTQSISVSLSRPHDDSRRPRCRLGPALRSTSSSRLEAKHGG
jgi:enamine deaminase RidA (YjgF/YER057c/UK114 family)